MKAEQRKELETNTLADKVGHAVQRVKSGQRRTIFFYVIVAAAIVIGIFLTYRWWETKKQEESNRWVILDDGSENSIQQLAFREQTTNAGKSAQLQLAWIAYWDRGIKRLGMDPKGAIANIEASLQLYQQLAKECADDKVFEPQAMLGIAVVEEALAMQDTKFLGKAAESYEEVFKKYEKSAEGIFAKKRFDELKDKKKRADIEDFYKELPLYMSLAQNHAGIRIQGGFPMQPMPPDPQPKLDIKKKDN